MAAKTFLKTTLTISLFFVVFVVSETAHAKTIYVDDNGPADFSNIQAAIDDANDGDIIIVNTGTYTGDGNRDIDFKGKAITVRSTDPNDPNIVAATVIDCEGSDEDNHRGFYFRSGEDENSILEGLTITNGLHSTGAGICCLGSSPAIRNNIITGNETGFDEDGGAGIGCWYGASPTIANNIISDNVCAPGGGGGGIRCFDRCSPAITNCTISRNSPQGINIHNGKPTISNCTFEGNLGGGISSSYFSSPIFINCTFIGNSSPAGGGMHIYESNPTLINCCFIQNVATTHGGGIWIYGWDTSSPTLINCTFAGNSAGNYGGGMYSRDNTNSMLVNCTFTGNSADDAGGAVYNYGYDRSVRITLKNCTFSGNSAAKGNDLACDSPYGPPSNVQVANCVIWDGENPIWNNDGSTITINYSDVHGGWPGQGNIDADPCFVDPDGDDDILGTEDDNLRLLSDSLCIDAGDPDYIAGPNETDLDGNPRVIAGRIDIGAYEFPGLDLLFVDDDAHNDPGPGDPTVSDPLEDGTQSHPFDAIQEAIDTAWDGDTVIVLDGTYTGTGNRDIDFLGKAITVRSIDPNDPNIVAATIIDCNGTEAQSHRGFVFNAGEDARSVLDGLTITNGFAKKGGGIQCINSSPTLSNCVLSRNFAIFISGSDVGGGGMYNENGSPRLVHCTFKDNTTSYSDGAGMYNTGGRQVLTKCTFINNSILGNSSGGGMFNKNCSVILEDCNFIGNSAHGVNRGGGVCNWQSNPTITNCTFVGNWAEDEGGGMCNWESSSTITNCTFILNRAENMGGGILNSKRSHSLLTNCIFTGNSAGRKGGAMRIDHGGWKGYGSNPILTNCTFTGNYAEEQGGAIHFQASSAELNNCTFSDNWAFEMGGAIYSYIESSVSLANCIIWNNAANYGSQIALELSNTISVSYCNIKGGQAAIYVGDGTIHWGVGNIDADPCFIKPGYWDVNGLWLDGDYHLLPDSPCIDTGDPNYTAEPNETDLDGKPRLLDGDNDGVSVVDMGAYEYRFTISAEARILPQTINLASKGNWITCYIWLPEQYNVADIDPNSIFLEDEVQPVQFSVDEQQQIATARFSREDVQPILDIGDIELTITGQLTNGIVLEAMDTIKVLSKARGK